MANDNVLKLLRNRPIFSTHEQALSYINTMAQSLGDGEFWAATYGTAPNAKSVFAFKRNEGLTIIDTEAIGDVDAKIRQAIEALNLATIATSGLASDAATTPITASSTTVAVTGSNASAQIASLAQTMKSVQDNASKYKIKQLTAAEVEALQDVNIKDAYRLFSFQGEETQSTVYTPVGDVVKIFKDSSLKECYLGGLSDTVNTSTGVVTKYAYQLISDNTQKITEQAYQALTEEQKALYEAIDSQSLNFVYQLADGTYTLVKIDVSKFLSQSEFKNGLEVSNNGEVSVKIDEDSDEYLTVSEDGVKLEGVKDAIDTLEQKVTDNALVTSAALNDLETRKATRNELNTLSQSFNSFQSSTNEAINDLEDRKADKSDVEDLSDNALIEVVAGNGIDVTAKQDNEQTVSVKLDTVQTDNVLSLSANGLYLSRTIDCGEY